MNTTTDTHGTPPGYWFGVIEHNLRASMRDELAELGLRRGSWRILHTLADGPASVEDIEASLPPRRHQGHGRSRGGRRGHGYGRWAGFGGERGFGPGADASGGPFGLGGRGRFGFASDEERQAFFEKKREQFGHPPFSTDEEREAFFAERERSHGVPAFHEGDERGPAPFASDEERHAFFAGMRAAGFAGGGRSWRRHPGADGFPGHGGDAHPDHHGHEGHDGHNKHHHHGAEDHPGHDHDHEGRDGHDAHHHHPEADHGHGHDHHRRFGGRGRDRAGRVASTLDAFVEKGWVSVTDGVAELTPEGRAAHDAAFERIRALRTSVAEGITDEDYATTMATLEAMARNLGWDGARSESSDESTTEASTPES